MTDSVNSGVTKAENIFKDIVWNPSVTAGKTALFAAVPWMNVWPIRPIVSSIVNAYTNAWFSNLKVDVDQGAIQFLNEKGLATYNDTSIKLRVIAADHGPDSPEYLKAREDGIKAMSAYGHYNQ